MAGRGRRWAPIRSSRASVAERYNGLPQTMAMDDAVAKLARQIDAARMSERFLVDSGEVANLRRHGASRIAPDLCRIRYIGERQLVGGDARSFTSDIRSGNVPGIRGHLIQISSQGREIQIALRGLHPRSSLPRSSLSRTFWKARFGRTTRRCSNGLRFGAAWYSSVWRLELRPGISSTGELGTLDQSIASFWRPSSNRYSDPQLMVGIAMELPRDSGRF